MKRSSKIQLTLVATAAAVFTGCSDDRPPRRCVDDHNKVVDEKFCAGQPQQQQQQRSGGVGFIPLLIPYHYYYGGARGYVPMGAAMSGGTSTPPARGFSAAPSSRGMFGGAGEAHGGGSGGAGE